MIREDVELIPEKIPATSRDFVYNCDTFAFRDQIVLLRAVKRSLPEPNRLNFAGLFFLEQSAADLVVARAGVQGIFESLFWYLNMTASRTALEGDLNAAVCTLVGWLLQCIHFTSFCRSYSVFSVYMNSVMNLL